MQLSKIDNNNPVKPSSSTTTSQIKPWHGGANLFNNRMNAFFSDTSYEKHKKNQEASKTLYSQLPDKGKSLAIQTTKAIHASICRITAEKWIQITKKSFKYHYDQEKIQEKAAITIQRHFRGFWTRLCLEDFIVKFREKRVASLLKESHDIAHNCFFNLGLFVSDYAIILQRSVKRYLFRAKCYRLIKAYFAYVEVKHKAASDLIRKFLMKYVCKEQIHRIVFMKFREKRLKEIRENLAFISLRKFWKKRKLTFRIIKDKLLRLKRKRIALAKKQEFEKLMLTSGVKTQRSINRSLTMTAKIDDDDDDDYETDDAEAAQAEKQRQLEELKRAEQERELKEKQLKDKVETSKAAYGIKDDKEKLVIPFLQERELNDNISNSLETRLYEATVSTYQKSSINQRQKLPQVRNLVISTSPKVNHKRFATSDCFLPPLLLLPTNTSSIPPSSLYKTLRNPSSRSPHTGPSEQTFDHLTSPSKNCKHRTKSQHLSFQPNPEKAHYDIANRFLIGTTISTMMKKSDKKQRYFKNAMNFSLNQQNYVPSLDNPAYSPKQWKPVELDKSIFESNVSMNFARSPNKGISNPTSFVSFSSAIMAHHHQRRSKGFFSNSISTHEGSTDFIPYYIGE